MDKFVLRSIDIFSVTMVSYGLKNLLLSLVVQSDKRIVLVFFFRTSSGTQPLNFEWTFGVNRRIPALNLTDENRDTVAYASSHVTVLYDFTNNKQKLLQGHVIMR